MNEDLISRRKVLAEIRRIAPITYEIVGSDAQMIMRMVEQLSSELEQIKQLEMALEVTRTNLADTRADLNRLEDESEPIVHAHWIGLERWGDARGRTHKCSRCEKHGYKDDKRCPGCGAIMDEKVIEPTPLIRLGLGGRIDKRLKQLGVSTAEQLEAMDKHTLYNIPGLGKKSIELIETELRIWKMEKEEVWKN